MAGAEGAATAGIAHARARLEQRLTLAADPSRSLLPEEREDPWSQPRLALPDTVRFANSRYVVEVVDLGAKLHLNRASEEEIRRLLSALRIDAGRADRLAQAISDWRDPDREHRARGAERDLYLEEGSPVLPEDGPFQHLEDLRYVHGMTPELYEKVTPFLTLSGTGRVNLNAADRPVLLALPGMTTEAAEVLVRMRRQGRRLASVDELPGLLSSAARDELVAEMARLRFRVALETRDLEVRSTGWIEGAPARVVMEGLLARGGQTAFLVSLRRL